MKLLLAALLMSLAWLTSADIEKTSFGLCNPWSGVDQLGVGYIRCGAGSTAFGWPELQPEPGAYLFEKGQQELEWIQSLGAEPLVILGYTPAWQASEPALPPRDLMSFATFTRDLVAHFKNEIHWWEVWNEPNIEFFQGSKLDYIELYKVAASAAKTGDPEAKVVLGGLAGPDVPFLNFCYQYGLAAWCDAVNFHPYQWDPTLNDGWLLDMVTSMRRCMLEQDHKVPLWVTEFGWSTGDARITEQLQARLLVQTYVTLLANSEACNLGPLFWFTSRDWGGSGYGLIATDDRQKPAFHAYTQLTSKLAGADYLGKLTLAEPVRGYLFKSDDDYLAVLWTADGSEKQVSLEVTPSSLTPLLGEAAPNTATTITVTGDPLYATLTSPVPAVLPEPLAITPIRKQTKGLTSVWAHPLVESGSETFWFQPGVTKLLRLRAYNFESTPQQVALQMEIPGAKPVSCDTLAPSWQVTEVSLPVLLPANTPPGSMELRLTGSCQAGELLPLLIPCFVSEGQVIAFSTNSYVERGYLDSDGNDSACAASVRFGSGWQYKFDLSKAVSARAVLDIGAHMANHWEVLASTDGADWTQLLEGDSWRSRHEIDLSRWAGGPLVLRIQGENCQLGSLELWQTTPAAD